MTDAVLMVVDPSRPHRGHEHPLPLWPDDRASPTLVFNEPQPRHRVRWNRVVSKTGFFGKLCGHLDDGLVEMEVYPTQSSRFLGSDSTEPHQHEHGQSVMPAELHTPLEQLLKVGGREDVGFVKLDCWPGDFLDRVNPQQLLFDGVVEQDAEMGEDAFLGHVPHVLAVNVFRDLLAGDVSHPRVATDVGHEIIQSVVHRQLVVMRPADPLLLIQEQRDQLFQGGVALGGTVAEVEVHDLNQRHPHRPEPFKTVEDLGLAIQQLADCQRILVVALYTLFGVGELLEKPTLFPPIGVHSEIDGVADHGAVAFLS